MKKGNGMKTLLWVALVALCAPLAFAMGVATPSRQTGVTDTIETDDADSILMDSLRQQQRDLDEMNVYIKELARAYGDSVVVRWGIKSYPEWNYLARTGVSIFRHDESNETFDLDTLVMGLKPLSLEQFRQRYLDTNDSAYVMVGDSMPLRAEFTPYNPNESPVFWMTGDPYAVIRNDTLVAKTAGECSVVAIGGSGRLSDTCSVTVIDRWDATDYSHSAPTDMVVYAKISVGGASWMPDSLPVAAVVRGKVAGVAVRKRFLDTNYSLIRIWAQADAEAEPVTFVCYDRRNFRLYKAAQCPGYTATQARAPCRGFTKCRSEGYSPDTNVSDINGISCVRTQLLDLYQK